tara:strand:- start:449 stop:808 length:360 start_codon:yes stop_codon:yes gene_type:complete
MWNKLMLTYLIETSTIQNLSGYYPGNSLWLNREELRTILNLVEEMSEEFESEDSAGNTGLGGRIVSRNKTTKKHKNNKKHKKTKHTTLHKKKYTHTQHSTRRNTKNKTNYKKSMRNHQK